MVLEVKKQRKNGVVIPIGSTGGEWFIAEETQNGMNVKVIRRSIKFPDGRDINFRLPVEAYRDIREDARALKDFVLRLNHRLPEAERTRKVVELNHAFINDALLEDYRRHLTTEIPNKDNVVKAFGYTKFKFLTFYINLVGMPDPLQWHKNQNIWAQALLNQFQKPYEYDFKTVRIWEKDRVPVAATIREIVANANRFMRWLHQRFPAEVPPMEFKPVSNAALDTLKARRDLKGLTKRKWFIRDKEWTKIIDAAPVSIRPPLELMWLFGHRRAEPLGHELLDVKKGFLLIERQLINLPKADEPLFDVLKGKKARRVEYWFGDPMDAYRLVKAISECRMHPDTLSKRWDELMLKLQMPYDLHDIRRTWITKCFRLGKLASDIQLNAGHTNIETTMLYKLDDRELGEESFVPGDN